MVKWEMAKWPYVIRGMVFDMGYFREEGNSTSLGRNLVNKFTIGILANKRVSQGCPLSSVLFNFYIDDIFRIWISKVDSGIHLRLNLLVNFYFMRMILLSFRQVRTSYKMR